MNEVENGRKEGMNKRGGDKNEERMGSNNQ